MITPTSIQVHGKNFDLFLDAETLQRRIEAIATELTAQLHDQKPLFIAILNGSFMFAADLLKRLNFECEISFVKIASYEGLESSGKQHQLIGLTQPLDNRTVVLIEDIVDSGATLSHLLPDLKRQNPAAIHICTLLLKPDALRYDLPLAFVGFEIPNAFVVGYGLDFDHLARNYPAIYQLRLNDSL